MEKNNNEKRFFFKNKANIIIFTILAILGIAASIIIPRIAGGGQPNSGNDTDNISYNDTTSYVTVGEIWTGTEFRKSGFSNLIKKTSGANSYDELVATLNSGNISAAGIRTNNDGKSVVVRLGGLDWIVTYVSKDTDGNPIATLWLSNSTQEAWKGRNDSIGEFAGFYEGGLYSDWSANWIGTAVGTYPSNMYGTSYIRTITLNNPSNRDYATSNSALKGTSNVAAQSPDNPFATFTMGSLTNYIVTPSKVSWQKTIQDRTLINFSNNLNNDSLSNTGGTYGSVGTYGGKTGYDYWGEDYIWLPSLNETGCTDDYNGIWETITSERENYKTIYNLGKACIGSNNSETGAEIHSWLRSVYEDYCYRSESLDELGYYRSGLVSMVSDSCAVRPALHLNLKAAAQAATATSTPIGDATVGDVSNRTYTGSAITPTVTITYDGTTLKQGTDYTVSYTANTGGAVDGKYNINAGTVTMTITGIGEYEGTTTKTFEITKATNSWTTTPSISSWTYGSPSTPNGAAKFGSVSFTYATRGSSSYSATKPSSAGSYTMKASVTGTSNYTSLSTTVDFNIAQANISSATITLSEASYTYDKSEKKPTVTTKLGSTTLTQDTDYTVSYTANTGGAVNGKYNINTGTVTITITGKGNYTGTKNATFVINKATITETPSLIKRSFEYTGKEIDVTKGETGDEYGNIKNFDETLMYITEDSVTKRIDVGSFTVKIALKDPNNYQWANGTSNVLRL